jgi:hypothetical protein
MPLNTQIYLITHSFRGQESASRHKAEVMLILLRDQLSNEKICQSAELPVP